MSVWGSKMEKNLLRSRDALAFEHATPGLAKHPVQQRKRLPEL